MKIRVYCDSGANIHSCREETIDTVEDWGLDEGEWEAMSDEDKFDQCEQWASDKLEIGWQPEEEAAKRRRRP